MKDEMLTSVFMRLRDRLLRSARAITTDSADAADAVQDTFCRLWARRDSITDADTAARIATVAVRNAGIDAVRRRRHLSDSELPDMADEPAHSADELFAEVKPLIESQLTERHRRILYLRDMDGWEIADIAAEFDTTEANIRVILSRARRTVRDCYHQRYER